MYLGSYKKDDDIRIPKNYNGTYFYEGTDNKNGSITDESTQKSDVYSETIFEDTGTSNSIQESNIGNENVFERIFGKDIRPCIPKFDAEDLLLLGLAAFLFLSKSGDKECAIILALLIFIT